MVAGRQMADEMDVRRVHGKSCGYCAPPITNRRSGRRRAGSINSRLERRLAVGGIGAEIGEIGGER